LVLDVYGVAVAKTEVLNHFFGVGLVTTGSPVAFNWPNVG
jgi:hypothetical protein